jgi:hypothetical protein
MRALLALCLLALSTSSPAPAQTLAVAGRTTFAAGDPPVHQRTDLRQTYQDGPFRIVVIESLLGERWELSGGLDSALLTAGPLRLEGLLREVRSPLRFGAASDVFCEPTDVSLDGSMSGSSVRGVLLRPLPGMLHLGMLQSARERNAAAGFALGDGAGAGPRLELLGVAGRPQAEAAGQEWYLDRPKDPGSPLGVVAGRISAVVARLRLDATGALSSGFGRQTGSFSHLRLSRTGSSLRSSTLLGAASPDYRTPEGKPCSYSWTFEQGLEVVAGTAMRIEASGRRVVARTSSSLRSAPFRRTADAASGLLEWTLFDRRATEVLLRGEAELGREWDSEGAEEKSGSWEATAGLSGPRTTLFAAAGSASSRPHGSLEGSARMGAFSAEGRIVFAVETAPGWDMTVRLAGRSARFALSLSRDAEQGRPVEMELAWEQRYRPSRALAVKK